MFGFRSDGVRVKDIESEAMLIPYIMKTRNDASNYTLMDVRCEAMDEWIREKREKEGEVFTYMDILVASAVRIYALRPKLNRFTIGNKVYQRNGLYVSFTAKRGLNDEAPDNTMKMRFTGRENIYQVRDSLNKAIKESITGTNSTGKTVNAFNYIPSFLVNFGVGCLKLMDKFGMLPKKLIDVSPFHTSFYLTNLKSLRGDWIFHHIYNFGTTGMFFSIGKEKQQPVVDDDEIKIGKVLTLGITVEERYCDGFYFVRSVRMWKKFLENIADLEKELDIEPIESKKERKKRLKQLAKEAKKQEKEEKPEEVA